MIAPGTYTIQQILDLALFDFALAGGDYRRVKVGKLGFDYLDQEIVVPEAATELTVELDGVVAVTLPVS